MAKQIADLHFTGGGSDKVYHLMQDGVELHIAYGKRGSGLATSVQYLATEAKAVAEFNKKFKEKLAKGYQVASAYIRNPWITADQSQCATQAVDSRTKAMDKTPSGFLPQLLNEIPEADAQKYIDDPAWGAQEKKNGRRHTFHIQTNPDRVIGSNKLGIITPAFVTLTKPVKNVSLDGEAIGGKLFVFDMLYLNDMDLSLCTYLTRYDMLVGFHKAHCNSSTELIPLFTTTEDKQALWDRVKSSGGEGIVFKRLHAVHTAGRPNRLGDQLKVIFWQHTQAIVLGITDGKRSVALGCHDPGSPEWKQMGNVTIPANYDMPEVGDYVEIRYKYYYEGGCLFQPQYEGITDVATREDTDYMKLLRFSPEE